MRMAFMLLGIMTLLVFVGALIALSKKADVSRQNDATHTLFTR